MKKYLPAIDWLDVLLPEQKAEVLLKQFQLQVRPAKTGSVVATATAFTLLYSTLLYSTLLYSTYIVRACVQAAMFSQV